MKCTNLDDGDEDAPSLLVERWLRLLDNGPSFSDSTRGLDGGTLELLPSSSSMSPSAVTLGDEESRLSPSSCITMSEEIQLKNNFYDLESSHLVIWSSLASITFPLIFFQPFRLSPFCSTILKPNLMFVCFCICVKWGIFFSFRIYVGK